MEGICQNQNTDPIKSKQNKQIAIEIYQNKSEVQGQKNPPTTVAAAVSRVDPAAFGGAAVVGEVAPRTPTQDAVLPITDAFGISNRAIRVIAVPVGAPLQHISVHVV